MRKTFSGEDFDEDVVVCWLLLRGLMITTYNYHVTRSFYRKNVIFPDFFSQYFLNTEWLQGFMDGLLLGLST